MISRTTGVIISAVGFASVAVKACAVAEARSGEMCPSSTSLRIPDSMNE